MIEYAMQGLFRNVRRLAELPTENGLCVRNQGYFLLWNAEGGFVTDDRWLQQTNLPKELRQSEIRREIIPGVSFYSPTNLTNYQRERVWVTFDRKCWRDRQLLRSVFVCLFWVLCPSLGLPVRGLRSHGAQVEFPVGSVYTSNLSGPHPP